LANRNAELYNLDNNIYNNDRDFAYNQTRDSVSDQMWQAEYDRAVKNDDIAYAQWLEEFQYGQGRDKIADEQWQAEYDRAIKNDDRDYANWLLEFAYQKESDAADRALTRETNAADLAYKYAALAASKNSATSAANSATSATDYGAAWESDVAMLAGLTGTAYNNAVNALAEKYGYKTALEKSKFKKAVEEEISAYRSKQSKLKTASKKVQTYIANLPETISWEELFDKLNRDVMNGTLTEAEAKLISSLM
jgi:uncharacterized protein YbgA (DUF1722 family)